MFGVIGMELVLIGVIGFLGPFLYPAIFMEYLDTGSMLSGVRVRALWGRIAEDPFEYLILFVYYYLVAKIIAPMAGMVLLCVGMFATIPWGFFTEGCLIGRFLAKRDQARRGGPKA